MKAYEVRDDDEGDGGGEFSGLVATERERPTPGPGEALVRMDACALNYRDLAVASAELAYPGVEYPVIPLSDGAGEVVELGGDVDRFAEGDRVATAFFPDWIDGPLTPGDNHRSPGGTMDGTLAEYITYPAEALVEVPDYLTIEEAGSLTCAAVTAWTALAEHGELTAGERVLCLGTGGVSTFALQFAVAQGAETVVTSSSDAKLERARELGADRTLNYEETPDWGEAVSEMTDGGVDHVIEIGGQGTLERSLRATGPDGEVHLIGVLTGISGEVDPAPIMNTPLSVRGVSVGSRGAFERMLTAMESAEVRPEIDRTVGFDEAHEAYRYVRDGAHQGKVAITID
ncbi:zinc-dependent alcohol dehydrogenase family protein [Halalkalicoccus subterraneus]|uniref:zinc-dependent alcohol dehydrogenase family protein n=1 Tax=Halalkalicoccus subterraneus TaxID=2675002 RepID=UPI000EFD8500|nr:NAD(P)-dependent alcohol dehydrogenase [Halalkalicoccus subterraneus]